MWVILTHWPKLPGLPKIPGGDVTVHFAAYFIAAILIWRSVLPGIGPYGLSLAGLVVFAALDEVTQQWVGRSPSWHDLLADVAGGVGGLVIMSTIPAICNYLLKRDL